MTVNFHCGWEKWAEVSLEAGSVKKGRRRWWRNSESGKGSMVTAFPQTGDREENGNSTKPALEKIFYTKTHHLALRLCSLFPNNALQQLVPKITEHAKSGGKSWSCFLGTEKKGRGEKLADEKSISMTFFFLLVFNDLHSAKSSCIPNMWILTKLTYLLLKKLCLHPTQSRNHPRSDYFSWKSDETGEKSKFHLLEWK